MKTFSCPHLLSLVWEIILRKLERGSLRCQGPEFVLLPLCHIDWM